METNPLPRPLPKDAVLVVNAHSRKGQDLFAQAKEKLEQAGVRLIAAHAVENPEKMDQIVRQAVAGGAPMVIVGGGDGSMSGTVDELVGKDCVFGVLPLGVHTAQFEPVPRERRRDQCSSYLSACTRLHSPERACWPSQE